MQRNYVGVRREPLQGLDLAQIVDLHTRVSTAGRETDETYLVDVVEVRLHALDGHVLVRLGRLGLEHLGERALALFADQPVL